MISIDRTHKCIFLTQSTSIRDSKRTWAVTIYQRVKRNGMLSDTIGFSFNNLYVRAEGKGMKARILNAQSAKRE